MQVRNTKESNQGITLIALIITIIILLILVGITIVSLTGENGILAKSKKAKEESNEKTATEMIKLKITNIQMTTYSEKQQMPSLQELADGLCQDNEIQYVSLETKKTAKLDNIAVGNANSIFTKLINYPYEFEINASLKLASIDDVKIPSNEIQNQDLLAKINDLEEKIRQLETTKNNISYTKLLEQPILVSIKDLDGWESGNFATAELLDSIKNYKFLVIHYDMMEVGATEGIFEETKLLPVDGLGYYTNQNTSTNSSVNLNLTCNKDNNGMVLYFENEKNIFIGARYAIGRTMGALRIRNIYGIK